ncbi:MAG: hypothetical protein ACQEXJ_02990 [Myxococcota bacterium]
MKLSARAWIRALAPLLLLTSAPAGAAPTALDVGPPDPPVVMALSGVGTLERQVDEFVEYMKRLGLDDPGIGQLRAEALETLGRRRGDLVRALGLNPEGSVALYVVRAGGRGMEPVFALDVGDRRAFVDALTMLEEADQWVPPDKEAEEAEVDERALAGGGVEVSVALPGRRGVVARIREGVAVVADRPEVLDAMRLGGGTRPPVADRLVRDDAHVGGVFYMTPAAVAAAQPGAPPAMGMIERVEAVGSLGPDGMSLWANGRFSAELQPFLKVGLPGPAGEESRKVMRAMAGRGTTLWWRWSFDTAAAWKLAGTMLGDARQDIVREMKDDSGLHLNDDVVEVFTGDLLVTCQESSLDCVLAAGTLDERRAAATMKKILESAAESDETLEIDTRARRLPGAKRLYSSTFVEVRPGSDERKEMFRVHWGTRDHALVAGFTEYAVETALERSLEPAGQVPKMLGERGFSARDVMAGYQLVQEPSSLLRQLLPVLRGVLPATNEAGIATRVVDGFMALQDRIVDSAALVEADGLSWTLQGEVRTLPSEGSEDWSPEWERRFEEALRLRYQGRIRSSNEALLGLAEAAPDTPWALKARTYALAGDDLSAVLMAASAVGWMMQGARMFTDGDSAPPAAVEVPARGTDDAPPPSP